MISIFQDNGGLSTVFIRFNCDLYRINGVKQNTNSNIKQAELLRCINHYKQFDVEIPSLSVI